MRKLALHVVCVRHDRGLNPGPPDQLTTDPPMLFLFCCISGIGFGINYTAGMTDSQFKLIGLTRFRESKLRLPVPYVDAPPLGALNSQDRDVPWYPEIFSKFPVLVQAGHSAYPG